MSKPRVAVVFGGRSSEHAVSDGRGQRAGRDRPDQVRGDPHRHHPGRPVGAGAGAGPAVGDRRPASCPSSTPPARRSRCPTGSGALVAYDPGSIPVALGEVDVVFPRAARPVRRGRHPPGPAGAGRGPLRRLRRAGHRRRHGQGVHEASCRRRAAGRPLRGGPRPRLAARPRPRCSRRPRSSAGRCSSSRPGPGPRRASPRRTTGRAGARPSRPPASTTPRCWSRPPSRPGDRVRGAGVSATTARRVSVPGEVLRARATTSSTTSRPSTTPTRCRCRRPPTSRPRWPRSCGRWPCARSRRWLRGPVAGRTSSTRPTGELVAQRDQHDARASRRCRWRRSCGRLRGCRTRSWSTGSSSSRCAVTGAAVYPRSRPIGPDRCGEDRRRPGVRLPIVTST